MSEIQLAPYINFQGRAREAMEFYASALGGVPELQTSPDGRVAHARLDAEGVRIVGSDGHPDYPPAVGDSIALALSGSDVERITAIFNALAEGGHIKGPLKAQPWGGGATGWLADKFGVNWMISIDSAS